MAQSKPQGLDKKSYEEAQAMKSEEEFKYSTAQKLQSLKFEIDELEQQVVALQANRGSDKKESDIQFEKLSSNCLSDLYQFNQYLGGFDERIKDQDSNLSLLKKEMNQTVKTALFNDQVQSILEDQKKIHSMFISFKKEINGLIERLKIDFLKQMQDLKKEIIERPSEIPELKKELDQKMQLIELNGQNAVIRSSNNEKQLMLVERKIEQIYQLIKSIELSRQETK